LRKGEAPPSPIGDDAPEIRGRLSVSRSCRTIARSPNHRPVLFYATTYRARIPLSPARIAAPLLRRAGMSDKVREIRDWDGLRGSAPRTLGPILVPVPSAHPRSHEAAAHESLLPGRRRIHLDVDVGPDLAKLFAGAWLAAIYFN
jgi:hypothetical protein